MSKSKRKTVRTDREECAGCGRCTPDRPEGAMHLMDGKARLVSDLFCDGPGACVGECPEEREAEPYDERKVVERIAEKGRETIRTAARGPKRDNRTPPTAGATPGGASELVQWPVRPALVPPGAPCLQNSDLVAAADRAPFAAWDVHGRLPAGGAVLLRSLPAGAGSRREGRRADIRQRHDRDRGGRCRQNGSRHGLDAGRNWEDGRWRRR